MIYPSYLHAVHLFFTILGQHVSCLLSGLYFSGNGGRQREGCGQGREGDSKSWRQCMPQEGTWGRGSSEHTPEGSKGWREQSWHSAASSKLLSASSQGNFPPCLCKGGGGGAQQLPSVLTPTSLLLRCRCSSSFQRSPFCGIWSSRTRAQATCCCTSSAPAVVSSVCYCLTASIWLKPALMQWGGGGASYLFEPSLTLSTLVGRLDLIFAIGEYK